MKSKENTYYETPSTTVVEVKTEGVICQSANLEDYSWNEPVTE
jgi:hypothetical protein